MDNPILLDFPYSFETERLIIRGPLPDDAAPLRQAVVESQPELKPWMPWAVEVPSEEWYRVRVREGAAEVPGPRGFVDDADAEGERNDDRRQWAAPHRLVDSQV
jgi:hypothetical protein